VSLSLGGKKKNTHKEHKERREKTYHYQWFLAVSVDKNKLSKTKQEKQLSVS